MMSVFEDEIRSLLNYPSNYISLEKKISFVTLSLPIGVSYVCLSQDKSFAQKEVMINLLVNQCKPNIWLTFIDSSMDQSN